ncbi:MAG: flagellar hook-basal body complex protein FliE [Clostridiales bacterium]|nr:flagellar hook-basal body complex protein FliE [Clostridiales bacterium]
MDITSLSKISTDYLSKTLGVTEKTSDGSFQAVFDSALELINQTNELHSAAEEEELNLALGYSENTHDLAIAQSKADVAIQYTVAVKNKLLEAYKEIMNIQI